MIENIKNLKKEILGLNLLNVFTPITQIEWNK